MKSLIGHFGLIVAVVTFQSLVSYGQALEKVPRLQPEQNLLANIGGMVAPITIKANSKERPKVLVHQVRSLDLMYPQRYAADSQAIANRGITLDLLKTFFKISRASFDDFYFVDYFAHGYKNLTEKDLLKTIITPVFEARHWTAVIPKSAIVNNIYVQREWFSGTIGTHGQIRFKLNTPILLFPRAKKSVGAWPKNSIIDLSTSIENDSTKSIWKKRFTVLDDQPLAIPGDINFALFSARYEGGPQEWSAAPTLGGAFAITYTLNSTDHLVVYGATHDYVEQIELVDATSKGSLVLANALSFANRRNERNVYHLIFNSCITVVMKMLGYAYDFSGLNMDEYSFNPYRFIENLKPITLSPVKSLNEEYGSPILAPILDETTKKYMDEAQTDIFDLAVRRTAYYLLSFNYDEINYMLSVLKVVQAKINYGANETEAIESSITEAEQAGLVMPASLQKKIHKALSDLVKQKADHNFEVLQRISSKQIN